ncbi:MAG: MFS transporter [Corynebacterium sp.]|nr:MFS transporter [Corynebacterium sp.]
MASPLKTKSTPYFLALLCFVSSFTEFALVGILDIVAESLGVSISTAGQLITIFALAGGIGVPIVFALFSKVPQRQLLFCALLLVIVGCGMTVVVHSYAAVMSSRILVAIGSGIFSALAFSIASQSAPEGRSMSAISTVMVGYNAALILGLPLGRLIAHHIGWKGIFLGTSIICLACIPIAMNLSVPQGPSDARPGGLTQQLSLITRGTVLLMLSLNFLWIGGYAAVYSYITQVIARLDLAHIASSILLGFGIATLFGSKLGGPIADKFGIRKTLLGVLALHALILLLLLTSWHSGPASVILLMAWGFCAWTPSAVMQQVAIFSAPDSANMALSLKSSSTQLAYAMGGAVGGLALSLGGTSLVIFTGTMLVVSAFIFAFKGPKYSQNTPKKG